jgi:hypothetical protein
LGERRGRCCNRSDAHCVFGPEAGKRASSKVYLAKVFLGPIRHKASLSIEFSSDALTAHAGLSLLGDFFRSAGWAGRIKEVFADRDFDSDYGSFRMTLSVIGLFLVGGTRLAHHSVE